MENARTNYASSALRDSDESAAGCAALLQPLRSSVSFGDGELSLEPLHPRYAADWLHQARAGDVLAMTQLPRFEDEREARTWLEERWIATHEPVPPHSTKRLTFAIVDARATFLGSLSLYQTGSRAFFSFWVGTDYQGRGIGTRAASMAHELARSSLGIRDLFTASFRHNHRSQRVLLRVGWTRLPFRGEPPAEVLDFFHRPLASEPRRAGARLYLDLSGLLRDIGSDFRLAEPRARSSARSGWPKPSALAADAAAGRR